MVLDEKFVCNKERLKLFFYTMYERQQIWYRRFVLNLPKEEWTTNEFYSKYRFTNVYRELDRTSQYLIKNIILNKECWHKYNNDEKNNVNLVWKILFYRMINNPRIYTSIDVIDDFDNYDPDKFYNYLKENVINKDISFGHGAFLQCTKKSIIDENGNTINYENSCEYFAKRLLCKLHEHTKDIYQFMKDSFSSNKSAYDFIKFIANNLESVGKFMAHELFQDLCYIKQYIDLDLMKYDANSATNAGPGSTGGTKYIYSNVHEKADVLKIIEYLRDISDESLKEIQKEYFPDSDGFYYIEWDKETKQYKRSNFNFTLNQIEMWLCEYYKYVKYSTNKSDNKINGKYRKYDNTHNTFSLLY